MATLISAPAQNRILNDANITEIIVEDTTSFDHYRASFYVDGVYFEDVVMPRFTEAKMTLVFENILLKYITLNEVIDGIYFQKFRHIRNLRIDILRFNIGFDFPFLEFTLNYKLLYSVLPTSEKFPRGFLSFIAVDADVLLVQPNTKIQLPVYANGIENTIICEAVTEDNVVLSAAYSSGIEENSTLLLSLDVRAPDNINAYLFRVKYGSYIIQKKVRIIRNTLYRAKKIRFYNRYGMPVLVELFGKLITKDEQTHYRFQNSVGVYSTEEIQTNTQVSIDTGYLLNDERGIINQIASSNKIQIEIEDKFIPCIVTIKNVPQINEKEFVNSVQLTFEFNKNPKIKN